VDVTVTSAGSSDTLTTAYTFLAFDPNGDTLVTAADIVYLVNYLYGGGNPPIGSGDADGDQQVDAADVFYTINYIFASGPAPM
jgi:hypothetical protein